MLVLHHTKLLIMLVSPHTILLSVLVLYHTKLLSMLVSHIQNCSSHWCCTIQNCSVCHCLQKVQCSSARIPVVYTSLGDASLSPESPVLICQNSHYSYLSRPCLSVSRKSSAHLPSKEQFFVHAQQETQFNIIQINL